MVIKTSYNGYTKLWLLYPFAIQISVVVVTRTGYPKSPSIVFL